MPSISQITNDYIPLEKFNIIVDVLSLYDPNPPEGSWGQTVKDHQTMV